jgi:hypothetical protein
METNSTLRIEKVMRLIDEKIKKRKEQYGCKNTSWMIPDILEEVSEEEHYTYLTLRRYYCNWRFRKGIFANEKH